MRIYFDDNLIEETDESGIKSLSNNFELFDSSFYLGSTASNTFNLTIDKEIVTIQPEIVTIYDETNLIATLVVDNIEEDDTTYTYTLTDTMLNLEFNYDASQIFNNGSATLLQIALDICSKAGIELATQNFRGYNKSISWYDNTRTARTYIGYIAELNGGYAQIGEDGKLYFKKQKQDSMSTISIEECSDFKIGDKRKITKVQLEVSSTLTYVFGDNTGNTLTLNPDNVFITTEAEVEGIYNDINNFTFYNFETTNCPIDFSIKAGNIISFTDGENEYPTIAQYNLIYNNEWNGGYSFKIDSIKQESTQIQSTDTKIKNLQTIVDRDTNTITQAIEEIDSQNEKISQVKQTVDELNSKISDIADITVSKESTNAYVEFENINQSEPIRVVVHPINGENNISYLYPRNNLYPSNNLFSKTRLLRFTNIETEESFDYILPDNLLYYASDDGESDVYDEFILDYEGQSCTVTKKVGYNADGTTYPLSSQVTTEYDYPQILLTDGNQYNVELVGYNSAYLFVRLMAQNIYTTQFATKAELTSEISQTSQEINLSVNKKLTNYVTDTEMNSAITLKADSITSSVSNTYATKNELSTTKSEIKQTTDGISSTVSSKVGKNEVVSTINQSAEQITLKSNRLVVESTNFKLDKSGNMTCKNATVTGGEVALTGSTQSYPKLTVKGETATKQSGEIAVAGGDIWIKSGTPTIAHLGVMGYYGTPIGNLALSYGTTKEIRLNPLDGLYFDNTSYINKGEWRDKALYNETLTWDANMVISNTGYICRSTSSSKRYKENITESIEDRLDPKKLYNLPIKQYKYKDDYIKKSDPNYRKNILGFIAEDVAEIYEPAVQYDKNNIPEMWSYKALLPAMLKLIQEQHKDIENLNNRIEYLENKLKESDINE